MENVAPLVGAWIEIYGVIDLSKGIFVAPLVGAWIEICCQVRNCEGASSLLSWERGLKWHESELNFRLLSSLLSWERGLKFNPALRCPANPSRSSRGSVD